MIAALAIYGQALRHAAGGANASLRLVGHDGRPVRRERPQDWTGSSRPGDDSLLARCGQSCLDVGCGPGRLTAVLALRGHAVLGIDISAEAVRQARRRRAPASRADVFGVVPAEGEWSSVLLADGNIGIGGDPERLLRRCAELLCDGGVVLVEVDPPGERSWRGQVCLTYGHSSSEPFAWATVSLHDIDQVAQQAGLHVRERWTDGGRWFTGLQR